MKLYSDSYKQNETFKQVKAAEEKSVVIKKAFNKINELLTPAFGSVSIDLQNESLVTVSAGLYSGEIDASIAINTSGGMKRVPFSILVKASMPEEFNKKDALIARIQDQLDAVSGEYDTKMLNVSNDLDAKISRIDAEQALNAEVLKLVEAGMNHQEAYDKVYLTDMPADLKVTAKHWEHSTADSVGGILTAPPEYIQINKVSMPKEMELNDTVNLQGAMYKLVESANKGSSISAGGQWVLKKQK